MKGKPCTVFSDTEPLRQVRERRAHVPFTRLLFDSNFVNIYDNFSAIHYARAMRTCIVAGNLAQPTAAAWLYRKLRVAEAKRVAGCCKWSWN